MNRAKESEETELKKDKQWAISELTKTMNFSKAAVRNGFSIEYFYGKELGTREAIQILKKLDEPEVLSRELPVIPKFVADWIEKYRERETNVWHLMNNVSIQKDCSLELWSWLWGENNADVLARAWLDGYTVEEEQKYVVEIGKSIYNTTTYGQIGEVNGQKIMMNVSASDEGVIIPNKYTKQEILKVKNGMDIFKDYAVKVEELEE